MAIRDRNVLVLYQAIFLIGAAYGVSISLTPLQLDALHFTKEHIGSLAAWFAGGIVVLSLPMGRIVRRFGARTTLITAIVGYAFCVAMFPLLQRYFTIAAIRFLDGAFSVGIWVSSETILLSRSRKEEKANATSLYAMSMASGYVLGPLAAKAIVHFSTMRVAFFTSAALALLGCLNVSTRLDSDSTYEARLAEQGDAEVESSKHPEVSTGKILWRTKTSAFATFAYGYFQASVVLFLPLFLIEQKGVPRERTILVPAFFAVGMLLCSNYAGRLGDRFGHLRVMRVLAIIGLTMIASFVFLPSFATMCVAVFIAGATLASISPVSLALQGIVTDRRDYSRANAIYNAFYATGMLIGPPLSSLIYGRFGGGAMLFHLAGLWVAFVAFTTVFFADDPAARRRSTMAKLET